MKIIDAINQVDELFPNTYTKEMKITWLSRLESIIKRNVIDKCEDWAEHPFEGFTAETDLQTELFMPEPYDQGYIHWLESQMDFANNEIDRYNNATILFKDNYDSFRGDYIKSHMPRQYGPFQF